MRALTSPGTAGVAVFEFPLGQLHAGGAGLLDRSGRQLRLVESRVVLADLTVGGAVIDQVLVVPRGDIVEVHSHGAPAVQAALLAAYGRESRTHSAAARLLQEAMSLEQFDLAVEQLHWGFDEEVAIIERLPDHERSVVLSEARERSRVAMAHVVAQRVVLMGAQNVGKSTLFNHLLLRERSLTGPLAGLTRDPILEVTVLSGYPYEVVDTAGECPAGSTQEIDALAIEAGRALREGALTVLVVDGHRQPSAWDRRLRDVASLIVASKSDLPAAEWPNEFPCHAHVSVQLPSAQLRGLLGELLRSIRRLPPAGRVGGFAALQQSDLVRLRG